MTVACIWKFILTRESWLPSIVLKALLELLLRLEISVKDSRQMTRQKISTSHETADLIGNQYDQEAIFMKLVTMELSLL